MNTDTLLKNKNAVIGIVLLLLAFFLYSMIVGPIESEPQAEAVKDENLVQIADELSGITFRQDLFSTPGYKALVDFSAPLPAQPAGRPNPFGVIGRD